jgi:pyruvate kinase
MADTSKEILCTLGPASLDEHVVRRLEGLGTTLFRINLSHTKLKDVASTIRLIHEWTDVPLCLDSEGAQIRTGDFIDGSTVLRENAIIHVHLRRVPGNDRDFNLYPAEIARDLRVGDFISIDFNSVLVQVIGSNAESVAMRVLSGGNVGSNKAVTVERHIGIPPLTEKDRRAIEIGTGMGIRHFALSFANRGADVDEFRSLVGDDAYVISKIESREGLGNLQAIMEKSDALLIDRGDLSRQIPIEQIPAAQKAIIRRCRNFGRKVYVATNLLESMVTSPQPTRAEANDIFNTLLDGANGLVLAAETAIGQYPIRCATVIAKMIQEFESAENNHGSHDLADPVSLLVEPHGGRLIRRRAGPGDLADIDRLPALRVSENILIDCEHLAQGTYSPLTGFMDRETLKSVLGDNRLPDGLPWTMPVTLQVSRDAAGGFGVGERVGLVGPTGSVHSILDVTEIFEADPEAIAEAWYGTASGSHPGAARVIEGGPVFVAGNVLLVDGLPTRYRHFELTPARSRFIFAHKGWSSVVGFATRTIALRRDERVQLAALEQSGADGLFINPAVGPVEAGEFLPDTVVRSYQLMLEYGIYQTGNAVLGSFFTYPRDCGPRETVFAALCRKNMGCSHFAVRDEIGDGSDARAAMRTFDSLGDIGITPLFVDSTHRVDAADGKGASEPIGFAEIRKRLHAGEAFPDWFMRDFIQDFLCEEMAQGRPMFHE